MYKNKKQSDSFVILGIDPGSHRLGYSFLKKERSSRKLMLLDYGTIEVPPKTKTPDNLLIIKTQLVKLLKKYKPQVASLEELFYYKNQKTVAQVYQARGAVLLILAEYNIEIVQPTVSQIKKGITGKGNADKKQIKIALKIILGLSELKGHDDSWDAIAAAFVGNSMIDSF